MEGRVILKSLGYVITDIDDEYILYKDDKEIYRSSEYIQILKKKKILTKTYISQPNEIIIYNEKDINALDKDYMVNDFARECGNKYEICIFKGDIPSAYLVKTDEQHLCISFRNKYEVLLFIESIYTNILSKAYTFLLDTDVKNNESRRVRLNECEKFIRKMQQDISKYSITISDKEYNRGIYKNELNIDILNELKEKIVEYDLL